VACIGAFAAPVLERTSGRLAQGIANLGDREPSLTLDARVAQFRLEMRLLAETARLWLRLPQKFCLLAVGVVARVIFFFFALTLTSALIQIGLAKAHELEITAIDVGQGDSIFVALPNGKLMLMDAGGMSSFGGKRIQTNLDIGEDVVSPYLWSRSIRRLDVVALSHAHEDHVGGMPAILENFHVAELWTGATPESPEWEAVRRKAAEQHVRITHLLQGRRFEYSGAQVEVLSPSASYVPAKAPGNNDSLVLRLTYGKRSVILSGDIERRIESELVAENLAQRADVLKVAHHGSKTSTTAPFLEAVHPAFAIISAGFENLYGHPHAAVVERLKQANIKVLRTDEMGAITVRTDGQRFEVETATGF
jgi:competence protein ComEC